MHNRPDCILVFYNMICGTFSCFHTGTKPSWELQVPSPPKPESAGKAVPDAGLQAGLLGRTRSQRATSTLCWPAAGHRAHLEKWAHASRQWWQQPQQPGHSALIGQPRQRGELKQKQTLNVATWKWNWERPNKKTFSHIVWHAQKQWVITFEDFTMLSKHFLSTVWIPVKLFSSTVM